MCIVDIIKQLSNAQGISITTLEQTVGLGNGTIGKWRKQSPSCDKLKLVADYLSVSIDYLLTGKEKSPSLPEDELELLAYYKELPKHGQLKLIGRAAGMVDVYKEQHIEMITAEPNVPEIEMRHSYYKVSAGTGYALFDEDQWDTIEVPDTPEARQADFCLTISGDSMKPVYYDGDIVLIKSQSTINNGEIGIFIIENAGYIKKYGGDRLISFNANYDDIMFSDYDPEDIRCVGLVIGRV